ncbi:MAG: SDR family oxidoreductase, partial [Pseudomonadota bacterium]|nr:SDR family oxidoreductase [Pseudomonadota bacterium]
VAVNYTKDVAAAEAVVAKIQAAGGRAHSVAADVADEAQVEQLFAEATRLVGPLAGLVNNAGISGPIARLDARDARDLERLLMVNVLGTMLCARAAVQMMSTRHGGQGGGIVNLSSVAARTGGFPGIAPYAATKGAIESFTKGLANEVAQDGIRVNAVAPGIIATDMLTSEMIEGARSTIPIGRAGQPQEVADAIAWLLSAASSYVTGSVLTVSGGR